MPSLFHSFIHLSIQQKFSKFSLRARHCADPEDTMLIERVFLPFLLNSVLCTFCLGFNSNPLTVIYWNYEYDHFSVFYESF